MEMLRWAERTDWLTAQRVDEAIDMLVMGTPSDRVHAFMLAKLVPLPVQRRVLNGAAQRRHCHLRSYQ